MAPSDVTRDSVMPHCVKNYVVLFRITVLKLHKYYISVKMSTIQTSLVFDQETIFSSDFWHIVTRVMHWALLWRM